MKIHRKWNRWTLWNMAKQVIRLSEIPEQHKAWLSRDCEWKHNKRKSCVLENIDEHVNHQNENYNQDIVNQQLSETDQEFLHNFHTKMSKICHNFCSKCNKRFTSIELMKDECHHYHYDNDNDTVKKFSAENNISPDEVPEELRGLTEIKEMLIVWTFPIIFVYYLRERLICILW